MVTISKCSIDGHNYKVDSDHAQESYYVKCVRCDNRILINDKTYELRKQGKYNL